MPYGYVTTAAQYKEDLKRENRDYEGRKTWDAMFSNIDLARQQQISSLQQDYSKAMGEAYASAYNNRTAVAASNIGQGYKLSAYDNIDAALEEAYDTYRANYEQNVSKVNQATNEIAAGVDEALTNEAQNYKAVNDSLYPYLQDLWNKFDEGELKDNIFYNNQLWTRYTREQKDETTGEIIKDAEGNIIRELMPFEDIQSIMYDSDGKITAKGREFIDQMLNDFATDERYNKYSFGAYLSKTNPELLDWLNSRDLYNFTAEGTKYGTYKDMIGPDISDNQYSFIERWGAMDKEEVDAFIEPLVNEFEEFIGKEYKDDILAKQEELNNNYRESVLGLQKNNHGAWVLASGTEKAEYYKKRDELQKRYDDALSAEDMSNYVVKAIDKIDKLADTLGIKDAYEKEYGINLDNVKDALDAVKVGIHTESDKSGEALATALSMILEAGGQTLAGSLTGGPVGALIGFLSSFISMALTGASSAYLMEQWNEDNAKYTQQMKRMYADVIQSFAELNKNKIQSK